MHFRGSLAENFRGMQGRSHDLEDVIRRFQMAEFQEVKSGHLEVFQSWPFVGDLLVISSQNSEDPFPSLPLIGYELLEDRQGGWLRPGLSIFDRAGGLGNSLKFRLLGKKPANLEIRTDAGFQPPKNFHEETVSEEQSRVTLFNRSATEWPGVAVMSEWLQGLRRLALKPCVLRGQLSTAFNHFEQNPAVSVVQKGIV